MASVWATSPGGLRAGCSVISESGYLAGELPERYSRLGQHIVLALYDVLAGVVTREQAYRPARLLGPEVRRAVR